MLEHIVNLYVLKNREDYRWCIKMKQEFKRDLKLALLISLAGIISNFLFRFYLKTFPDDIHIQKVINDMMPIINLLWLIFFFFMIITLLGFIYIYIEEHENNEVVV